MVRRDIFKKERFWEGKSYKLHIYGFMILIAVVAYFVASYGGSSDNVLQRVTSSSVIDVPEIIEVKEAVPMLPKGENITVGDKIFMVNKIDKEYNLRSYAANGIYHVFTFTVTSAQPYVPEPRIISGNSVLAPETEVEGLYGDKVLRQVEGTVRGIRVFDIPKDFDDVFIDLDVNINSTIYKIR